MNLCSGYSIEANNEATQGFSSHCLELFSHCELVMDSNALQPSNKFDISVASSRSSIKQLYDVLASFDEPKKELVRSPGFGGLLKFPALRKINRRFAVWLMSKVLYLDCIDVGFLKLPHDSFPRIKHFNNEIVKSMILADSIHGTANNACCDFGKSKLRDPNSICYSWTSAFKDYYGTSHSLADRVMGSGIIIFQGPRSARWGCWSTFLCG
ncbi:hypothetical protein PVAP13_3KG265019 [Panicum virgatum]|uniref:Uncharacterized protein n=1 Tax=Panicum virgatum TaxID=38727 RepID=A0A8T0V0E7_PANVG|nr:hypothetical protein PVAP13_3KG265019 [Panicum virgatum]KAG2627878.1 hypothetical protein PVAP13_3KG265019 [Panicum virgatum]KAG2627879.1 hypothetical protein PVAP13_3KG265019 [Panicum virgatum]